MRLRSTLILTCALAACACERPPLSTDAGRIDSGPCTPVPEDALAVCDDGVDNDCDGHVDCNDTECCGTGVTCGAMTMCGSCTMSGPENTADACMDNMDNDCDGFRDCDGGDDGRPDNDCRAICGVENSNPACADGVDNNMNGFIDCMDFDCDDRVVCSGEASNATCSDGMDNDEDGDADCADEDCRDEAIVVCDGADPADPLPAPSEWAALITTRCTNTTDDDGDERIDCGEFSCLWNHPGCESLPSERGNAQCSDGIDNDLDGDIDCDEPQCLAEGTVVCRTPGTVPPMAMWADLSNAECSNGTNDDAGETTARIDCMDFDCTQNPEITAACPGENTNALCSDGMDNDTSGSGVGHIDCEDFACSQNPRVTVCMTERTFEDCSDGMDNDADGSFDCDDYDCLPPEGGSGIPSPACY